MNAIQNYSSVNVNSNYGKVNKSPNFKAFNVEKSTKMAAELEKIYAKDPSFRYNIEKAINFFRDTKFFDFNLMQTKDGLRLKLSHSKNFVWPTHLSESGEVYYGYGCGAKDKVKQIAIGNDVLLLNEASANGDKIEYTVSRMHTYCDPKNPANNSADTSKELLNKCRLIQRLEEIVKSLDEGGMTVKLNLPYHALPTPEQLKADNAALEAYKKAYQQIISL